MLVVGGVLVPSGEAAGGQGVPEGVMPGVPGVPGVPCLFPEVEGEPGLEDPVFGVELSGLPGKVPQGLVALGSLGVVVLGSIGDGCVLLPGVGVFGEFEPGTVVIGGGVVGVAEFPGGVTAVPCGVAGPAGGVAVPGV